MDDEARAGLISAMPFAAGLGIALDAASPDEVRGLARPLHVGRSVIVVQTELRDDEDRLVAQVTQSQAVLAA
jgi:acyl-coenzyme A thioesterase PaaI-like protein